MPKQKTRKSLIKKIKITGSGKITVRGTGQNHHNTRDTGKATRAKRGDKGVYPAVEKNIQKELSI